MENRWIINKLGLIDFWYYDCEEFELSDGKLLLRGTNGSGKSVTMQSFIPLLLDGNKSPERLDPFGTRSRKLENYLLDEDTDERTAYLYIEFKKQNSENYVTIGMGVKAQKSKSLDSWYFIINDGRRVNKDIYLYKSFEAKVALTKKQLQNELGSGNFFTEYQQKYMEKVNEVLFGYDDVDGYEELLNLLIQLRSPKLSKDFKPTEIYNILTNSLKLLSEDDLRPMSESMENMDQLQNSLEEKERALKAVSNIKYHYDKYNRFCLYEKAKSFDLLNKEVNSKKRDIDKLLGERKTLEGEQQQTALKYEGLKEELGYAKEKYDNLKNNDGFKIKEKLQGLGLTVSELRNEIADKENQLEFKKKDEREKEWKLKEANDTKELLIIKAKEKLKELSELAEEFSFSEGEYLQKEVLDNIEVYDFSYLELCLQKYSTRIKEIKKLLKEYEEKDERFNNLQKHSDGIKNEKVIKEIELEKSNMMLTEIKEETKEKYNKWVEVNKFMKVEKAALTELFMLISEVDGGTDSRAIGELDAKVTGVFNSLKGDKAAELQYKKKNIEECKEQIALLREEIEELLKEKDIEPIRQEGVIKNRERLRAASIPFVPLYKAIDFNKNTPEATRRAIESALNDMGILDALIINQKDKEKAFSFEEGQWDKYIAAAGNMLSHNLSFYCTVNNEELNGVSKDEIYNVLQSIYLEEDNLFSLDEKGNYTFGALKGKASEEYEAKHIGILARKRHREQLIEERKQQIAKLEKDIEELNNDIKIVLEAMALLDKEYRERPSFRDIQESVNLIDAIAKTIVKLEDELIKVEDELLKEKNLLNELKGKLYEAAQGITIEKTLKAFEEAEETALDFKGELSEVKVIRQQITGCIEKIKSLEDNLEVIASDVDNLYREISLKKGKLKNIETEVKALQDALSTFDIGALEEDMEKCLHILRNNPGELEGLQKRSGEIEVTIRSIGDNIDRLKEELVKKEKHLVLSKEIFLEELSLKYVLQEEEGEPLALLKKVLQAIFMEEGKDRSYYAEQLIEAHHKNSGELREFNSKIVHIFDEANEEGLEYGSSKRRIDISCRVQGKDMYFNGVLEIIKKDIEELRLLINTEERRIFEEVLLNTISSKISAKIWFSKQWVDKINSLMETMNTSSSLALSLKWVPKKAEREDQLDITELLEVLERGGRASDEDMRKLANHFGDKVKEAIRSYEDTGEVRNYHSIIKNVLDYRQWFEFKLFFTKKNEKKKELTNNAFFQFSGGEKAMSMYIPLFSAVYARYENARKDCPRIISMDEAFAGVDENNIRDMFRLLKELRLDYLLNSQVLWGDYDTVDDLSICELIREENDDVVTVIKYHWNGVEKKCLV